MLELKKNLHPEVRTIIDITRIRGLDFIHEDDETIHIGPLVTHNQCLVSETLIRYALPLVKAAQSIGAAQIRNAGTVYGNLITASPANDTISPLIALDAEVLIRSKDHERWVKLTDFYMGVRKTTLERNELVADMKFRKMGSSEKGVFAKYLLRQTHGISVANASIILSIENNQIQSAKITLGAVAPTIVRAEEAETYLIGKTLTEEIIAEAAKKSMLAAKPITDVRASEPYRNHLIPILVEKGLSEIMSGEAEEYKRDPVLLWGKIPEEEFCLDEKIQFNHTSKINTHINGKDYQLGDGHNQSLLGLVRDNAGFTGSKLGCGEGECGSCTLFFNHLPVLSCLIPAPRAHQSKITTIEGVSENGKLHPIQQAFIDEGAVQCGYCTPGFIMSAIKLLEEKPAPTRMEIMEGLAGNICRCTGYNSIITAVETAASRMRSLN
jgi:carbon-monoxide dehydrogenase medium subunit